MSELKDIRVKSTELMKLCGINKSTLDRWIWQGIFVPFQEGQGSGKHREYTFIDIMSCHILSDLNQSGVRLSTAREIVNATRNRLEAILFSDMLSPVWLLVDLIAPEYCRIVKSNQFQLDKESSPRILLINIKEIAVKIKLAIS